jgi:hypothetical protein
MYGVPSDLPLARLIGQDLDDITLCKYQICFRFDDGTLITPTTAWELRDPSGALVGKSEVISHLATVFVPEMNIQSDFLHFDAANVL